MVEAVEVRDKQSVFWHGDAHSAGMLCQPLGCCEEPPGVQLLPGCCWGYSSWTWAAETRSGAWVLQPSHSLCSSKADRPLARSGVFRTWVWYVSQGTKTPIILNELPDTGVGKDKGLPAVALTHRCQFALC